MHTFQHRACPRRRGAALVLVTLLVAGLASFAVSLMAIQSSSASEQRRARAQISAMYVTEAALNHAYFDLKSGGTGAVGTAGQPISFGGSQYWVDVADLGGGKTSLDATGYQGVSGARVEVVLAETSGSFFDFAAFGDESLDLSSSARIDSYDSTLGTYVSQATNGSGTSQYAAADGDVGSNGDIYVSQNASIWGDAQPGPTSMVDQAGSNTHIEGATIPATSVKEMPAITVPPLPSNGALLEVSGGDTIVLASGDHHYDDLYIQGNGTLLVVGPARLVFSNAELRSGAEFLVDSTGGAVEVYVTDDFILNSNTLMASQSFDPSMLALHLTSDNIIDPDVHVELDTIELESNAKFYGTIYAPNSQIEIESNFELFGSVMSRLLSVASNARIHFDENLTASPDGSSGDFQPICWQEKTWSAYGSH